MEKNNPFRVDGEGNLSDIDEELLDECENGLNPEWLTSPLTQLSSQNNTQTHANLEIQTESVEKQQTQQPMQTQNDSDSDSDDFMPAQTTPKHKTFKDSREGKKDTQPKKRSSSSKTSKVISRKRISSKARKLPGELPTKTLTNLINAFDKVYTKPMSNADLENWVLIEYENRSNKDKDAMHKKLQGILHFWSETRFSYRQLFITNSRTTILENPDICMHSQRYLRAQDALKYAKDFQNTKGPIPIPKELESYFLRKDMKQKETGKTERQTRSKSKHSKTYPPPKKSRAK
eukprot:CAMPEP_0182445666 /NCGR_PEP_ID=MMETSP1172-20130603/3715_1 /TAXON_ID=708627 /ORGANISM="Timspurckia oligopyrenoides, Strain CCMP3278" /LENGTH=289 /DNA_ID=CAMNT_0024641477 /DNA_START=88 /DNA_END=957 /DNA_ORIENTATION=+